MFRTSLAIIWWYTHYNISRSYYSYNGSVVCCTNYVCARCLTNAVIAYLNGCEVCTSACDHLGFHYQMLEVWLLNIKIIKSNYKMYVNI
jgi:hypothetical protein